MRHAWIAFALVGCASDALPPPDVALFVGQETTAWTQDPQAARLRVELVPVGATPILLKDVEAPPAAVAEATTPTIVPIDEQHFQKAIVASFRTTGVDTSGNVVLRGDSIFYGMSSIYAVRIPIFMGRVEKWARPLTPLERRHLRPAVTSIYELLVAAGGETVAGQDAAVPEFFDTSVWQTGSTQPPLPRVPRSIATLGTWLVALNETGATSVDLAPGGIVEELPVTVPALDFAQLTGGDTVSVPNGPRFIIGGTRQEGAPSDQVLRLDLVKNANGEWKVVPAPMKLSAPRLGAAASLVGTTLVVVGGSATAPMVEVLLQNATSFMQLPYPPDPTTGHGVAPLDDKMALVVGGHNPAGTTPSSMRTIDVTCAASCAATDAGPILDAIQMPVTLTRTKAFALDATKIVFVGEVDQGVVTGVNQAFSMDPSQTPFLPKMIALNEPRAKATAALLPNGQVAMAGGHLLDADQTTATSLEVFIP